MGNLSKEQALDHLGNHIYLEKQDKLRDIGVDISTSQIVVVGSQSSGKSSLLENLTGFSFPRGQGLCTRYATQITLRRNLVESIVISITPSNDANPAEKQNLRAFQRELADFEPKQLASVMEDANKAMGIRSGDSKDDMTLPVFSDHILKIEISGPDKPHLTVIDVPGLFQVTGEGTTTDNDKALVENMVRRYMENERTIVLAVMSCLADRATEGIMQLAKAADPKGKRTVGVLTKADLVREQAVHKSILELVKGDTLKLGYFVVRSRGADEDDLDISDCRDVEKQLFGHPSWEAVTKLGRTGVQALKTELQVLLTDLAKRELPKQREEVASRLEESLRKLSLMGPARSDAASQREYLVKITMKFERISRDAREGYYEGEEKNVFYKNLKLRLITRLIDWNEGFADLMVKKGHTYAFDNSTGDDDKTDSWVHVNRKMTAGRGNKVSTEDVRDDNDSDQTTYETAMTKDFDATFNCPGLNIGLDKLVCPTPVGGVILDRIETCYRETRGPELGTFAGALLARTFHFQSEKWAKITLFHVKAVIVMIHELVQEILAIVCAGNERVRWELWQTVLLEKLKEAYDRAISHAHFLINVERDIRPSTLNHYFSDNLQRARLDRLTKRIDAMADQHYTNGTILVNLASLNKLVDHKSNVDQVKEEVHDILKSYYKVARKRFVDNICRQVIDYHLLDGPNSPLKLLSPEVVMAMSDTQLDRIAGEDAVTKRERERLKAEVQGLEEAMEVLKA